jgi:hypothetical protein
MTERRTVTREVLQAEAQLLGDLIEQHRQDLQAVREKTRFIYFVDAHELKAYISANNHDKLEGFVFSVELALEANGVAPDIAARVRLKAEQIQRRLLFDQPHQLLVLPSHAEEMDEEMAFISTVTLRQDYDLTGIARQQWARLVSKGVSREDLAQLAESASDGDRVSKRRLLKILTSEVPALVQLLFPAPDSLKARLTALLSHSRVSLLSSADWNRMGFDRHQSARLGAVAPSIEDLTLWTRHLIAGRRNSLQANRRDASALAYLSALNRCFVDMGVNAKACLITRAITLLRTMRVLKASGNVEAQDCLRHSRLVVTPADNEGAGTPVGDRTLDVLLFALQTYDKRLAIRSSSDTPTPEATELLTAWNAFEDARLTLELAQESPDETKAKADNLEEEQWRELVAWLQSDGDVSRIVEQRLQRQVAHFKASMVARDAKWVNQAPVWVCEIPGSESRRVQAIEVNGLGPLELPGRFFNRKGAFRFAAEPASDDVSEEFVALAFLQGCQKQWTLARFYGRQALQSAKMMNRGGRVLQEARLLQAQLLRSGGVSPLQDTDAAELPDRYSQAAELLLSRTGRRLDDPRAEAEWWALQLERLLDLRAAGSGTGRELMRGVQALRETLEVDDCRIEVRIRLQELVLAYVLVGLRKWKTFTDLGPSAFSDLRETAWICHRGLIQDMDEWRCDHDMDELPQFSRAMEILGYELMRRLTVIAKETVDEEPDVPAALLFDVVTLQSQMTRHVDEVSKLVAIELVRLIDLTRGRRQFQVVYAPVADRAEVLALIQTLPDASARDAAKRANEIVHDLGNSQRFLEGQETERQKIAEGIREFDKALSMPGIDKVMRYHLEVELAYLGLLAALAEKKEDRQRALEEVALVYEALVRRYPDSSVLHYRLSIVLGDLGKNESAFEEINEAMRLVATDTHINPDHWFRSVVRRRLALCFSGKATEMRDRLKGVDDVAARKHYLEHIAKAYQLVSEGNSPSRTAATYIARLEARRRLNNQVYYAALYGSGGGDIDSLPNLSRERLLELIRQLLPEGDIHDVPEIFIAHTIGLAYSALAEVHLAAEAAARVMQLIARSGDNAESDSMRQILNDALLWMGAPERESVPVPLTDAMYAARDNRGRTSA